MSEKSLSILVPAFNEENRIKPFLKEVISFKKTHNYLNEIIIVDDGSTDKTLKALKEFEKDIKIISYKPNRGKGFAVKTGILAAKSDLVVFMDADGSTPVSQIPKMANALKKYCFVAGQRSGKGSNITDPQPFYRIFAGKTFNAIVRLLFRTGINDSLCGFKGFRKQTGKMLANKLVSERWVFDVEMFVRAKKAGIEIGTIPITWKHVGNAKMSLGLTNIKMLLNLILLKISMIKNRQAGK